LSGFAVLALAAAEAPPSPALTAVRTVYILPMSRGIDQFLADRLTVTHAVQVVSDPQKADAVFTDHLGENFEQSMETLYPKPAPPKTSDAKEDTKKADQSQVGQLVASSNQAAATAPVSTFGRGRGTFFLVDRRTRDVLWSTYQKPTGSHPEELKHTAEAIVKQFKAARSGKAED
jgi:hypothetical protein